MRALEHRPKSAKRSDKTPEAAPATAKVQPAITSTAPDVSGLPLFLSSAGVPAIVHNVLQSPGQPLDDHTRASMSARIGHDFSGVQLHTGDMAAQSAESVAADAYTVGSHVVFNRGRYAPATSAGQRLLAHELTHVAQQGASSTLHRQPKPKDEARPKRFYQYVIDELASQEAEQAQQRKEKKYEFEIYKRLNYEPLKALLPLCVAVEEERTKDLPKLVDEFVKKDHGPPIRALTNDLLIELAVRLITLGLDAEATKLREKYSKGEEFDNFRGDVGLRDRNIRILSTLVDRHAATADFSTNEAARSTMAKYLKVLVPLRDDMLAMDEFERQHQFYKPYLQSMEDVLRKLVTAMALGLQTLSDRAVKELGTGKSADGKATLLLIREQIEGSILPSVDKVLEKRTIANTKITLVPTEIKDGSGVIRDAFDKSRTVKVSTYTPGQQNVRDLEGTVRDIFFRRAEQVALLARIYGQTDVLRKDRPGEKSQIEDARQNAEVLKTVIAAGGQLRLDSDDDWRAFVLAKYRQMTTGTGAVDKATSFSAVMKLLFAYLSVFTVHARFTNIYDQGDFKDAYFNKPFPRILSGEMVQDCGVYAMRVAYVLSLVRDELGLTFKFIRLPAHVGLIISGTDLPLYVAHNNHYTEVTRQKLDELRDGWKKAAPRFATVHKDTPIDEEQLIGELASAQYISGQLSTPFRISDVPGSGRTPVDTQKALWKEYTGKVGNDVFGTATEDKTSPGYLFHNRYLKVTERYRELHNDYLVPFWNVKAPAAWKKLDDAIKSGGRRELAGSELASLLAAHVSDLDKAEESHKVAKDLIKSTESELSKQLREVPKLKAPRTRASREGAVITVGRWEDSLDEYRARIATMVADAKARPGDKFTVSTVVSTLNPPFIPVSEKGLRLLDL